VKCLSSQLLKNAVECQTKSQEKKKINPGIIRMNPNYSPNNNNPNNNLCMCEGDEFT
jgi:hypothetical protein